MHNAIDRLAQSRRLNAKGDRSYQHAAFKRYGLAGGIAEQMANKRRSAARGILLVSINHKHITMRKFIIHLHVPKLSIAINSLSGHGFALVVNVWISIEVSQSALSLIIR